MFLCSFPFFSFCSVSDGKSCFSFKKLILTSAQTVENPFAGQNTQQMGAADYIHWFTYPFLTFFRQSFDRCGITLMQRLWCRDFDAEIVEMTLVVSWFRFLRVGSRISVLCVIILPGTQILKVRSWISYWRYKPILNVQWGSQVKILNQNTCAILLEET